MSILDAWFAHEDSIIVSVIESTHSEREYSQLLRDAETAQLRRQIAEDTARAEFLEMTVEELAQFRAWLRDRGANWQECER
jgi:hypothetical protein